MPKISVILPVYNGAEYLRASVDSLLCQTFTDFELIAINDGSRDNSLEILKQYRDSRLRVIDQENRGLAATLNIGIEMASGEMIARQDQDDISLSSRFEKQLAFFEKHPEVAACGTWAKIIDVTGLEIGVHRHPRRSSEINFYLNFNNPFVHSSMMFKKEVFQKIGLYTTDKNRQPPEDYELFSRISRSFPMANIGEPLVIYREVRGSMSRVSRNPFLDKLLIIAEENIRHFYSNCPSDDTAKLTAAYLNGATGWLHKPDRQRIRRLLLSPSKDGVSHRKLAQTVLLKAFIKSLVRKP